MSCSTTFTTKGLVHPVNTQISMGCPHEENLGPYSYPMTHSEDWSDWRDAQADMSLHWAHRSFCWFCHASAQMVSVNTCGEGGTISSFANRDKLCPIKLNYALLKHLTCQEVFKVAKYLC